MLDQHEYVTQIKDDNNRRGRPKNDKKRRKRLPTTLRYQRLNKLKQNRESY